MGIGRMRRWETVSDHHVGRNGPGSKKGGRMAMIVVLVVVLLLVLVLFVAGYRVLALLLLLALLALWAYWRLESKPAGSAVQGLVRHLGEARRRQEGGASCRIGRPV